MRSRPSAERLREFEAALRAAHQDAADHADDHLGPLREQAQRYYRGEPFGDVDEGRSAWVQTELGDTVLAVMPHLLGRLVRNAVAEGGSTGAALQQGAIDFAATGHALNSMLQEASRSPGDPRYQNFTSLLFENMAKQDAARTDQGSEDSA